MEEDAKLVLSPWGKKSGSLKIICLVCHTVSYRILFTVIKQLFFFCRFSWLPWWQTVKHNEYRKYRFWTTKKKKINLMKWKWNSINWKQCAKRSTIVCHKNDIWKSHLLKCQMSPKLRHINYLKLPSHFCATSIQMSKLCK